jgi:xanthine/uracil permease
VGVVAVGVLTAVVMAAAAQNGAVAAVVEKAPAAVLGGAEFRTLARSRVWLGGISLTAQASRSQSRASMRHRP